MSERVILADCCEDWIVDWGGFYEQGRAFACPECATGWTKTGPGRFRRMDGREFERRARRGPEAEFTYLASASGHQPIVERCCAKILLRHGERRPEADGHIPYLRPAGAAPAPDNRRQPPGAFATPAGPLRPPAYPPSDH